MNKKIIVCLTILFYSVILSAQAKAEKSKHRKPPKEAFEACENKVEGEKISFMTPRGDQLEATCKSMKDILVAVPLHGKKPPKRNKDDSSETKPDKS